MDMVDTSPPNKSPSDVIQCTEVAQPRDGVRARMNKESQDGEWKEPQARARKGLLKRHKPEEVPLPTFDPLEPDP